MPKVTLSNVGSLIDATTAASTINANSAVIQTAFDNTLSLDGSAPNQMQSNLDMNTFQILNLPAPASGNSPVRLVDVVSNPTLVLTIPPVGTSGAVVGLLNTNNTYSGTSTFTNTVTLPSSITLTTPNIGVATATTVNGQTINSGTGSLTLGSSNLTISGNSTLTGSITNAVFYDNIPQNSQSAGYNIIASDAQKHIFHPSADTTARTWTIPANASVAFPVGTAISFVNQHSAGVLTIAITTDTMRLAGAGTTGSRTIAADGIATALKVTSTEWIISGTGLT